MLNSLQNEIHFSSNRFQFCLLLQKRVRSIQHLAQLKTEERRNTLKFLSDSQYEDLVKVLGRMPYIDFKVRCEGLFAKKYLIANWFL